MCKQVIKRVRKYILYLLNRYSRNTLNRYIEDLSDFQDASVAYMDARRIMFKVAKESGLKEDICFILFL